MAKKSLASPSRPGNPSEGIARLIEISLEKHCSLKKDNYLLTSCEEGLATLVGLGFTALLAGKKNVRPYWPHLSSYVRHRGRLNEKNRRRKVAIAASRIAYNAMGPFKGSGCPRYFDDFALALSQVINPSGKSTLAKKEQVKDTLRLLFGKA